MFSSSNFDEKEYVSSNEWTEIKCITKRLYSDFIVIEIPSDGQVLQSISTKSPNKQLNCIGKEKSSKDEIPIPIEFGDKANEIQKFKEVAEGIIEECTVDLKDFTKDVRKKLHKFIADSYGDSLFSRCENGQLRVKKSNGKADENRKRRHWPEERGDFLHFTMAKENMDTHSAICVISRKLGLKPSSFSTSGTKDRRAITVQRLAVYRTEQSRLENLHFRGIWLSDFVYSNAKLQLGDARGNNFSIILRDIQPHIGKDEFNERVEAWERNGFLNYFGSQRFGTCGVNTAEIGKFILSEKWEDAIRKLLAPRNMSNDAIQKSLECFIETGDAGDALKLLPFGNYSTHIERNLLSTLAKSPNAYKAAILALPRDVRTMYIHAYQSAVFNRIITMRKKTFGMKILEGDLDKDGNPIVDLESADIEQICLPLPSSEPNLPKNEVGKWYEEIAQADQISGVSFQKLEIHFAIGSVYRPFVVRPKNVAWEMLEYFDSTQVLQHCEFVPEQQRQKGKSNEEKEENGHQKQPSIAMKVQFDLQPGTYATIALRELMHTDFSKDSQRALEEEIKKNSC